MVDELIVRQVSDGKMTVCFGEHCIVVVTQ